MALNRGSIIQGFAQEEFFRGITPQRTRQPELCHLLWMVHEMQAKIADPDFSELKWHRW